MDFYSLGIFYITLHMRTERKEERLEAILEQFFTILKRVFKVFMESKEAVFYLMFLLTSTHIYADYLYLKYPAEPAGVVSWPEWNLMIQATFKILYYYFFSEIISSSPRTFIF